MKVEVLAFDADPFIEDLKSGNCHLVSIGAIGLTHFSAYCEFGCGLNQDKQAKYVRRVNQKKETGTIFPKANITIIPHLHSTPSRYSKETIKAHLRDALIAEKEYLKTKFVVFDYRCCRLSWIEVFLYNQCVQELLRVEFAELEGTAVIYSHLPYESGKVWINNYGTRNTDQITLIFSESETAWRKAAIEYEITPENLLPIICTDSTKAARLILDWAQFDLTAAGEFIAGFLAKAFRELNVRSSYLQSIPGESSFDNGFFRPSISDKEFENFCALLEENPELVKKFRNNPIYRKGIKEDLYFFADPETKRQIREQERQTLRTNYETERKNAQENKIKKKQERLKIVQKKVEERKLASTKRKAERMNFKRQPLEEQIRRLVNEVDRPVKAFPIDPSAITLEVLAKLEIDSLYKLPDRISNQRPKAWKELAQRILKLVDTH
jgi:hypothetical protein